MGTEIQLLLLFSPEGLQGNAVRFRLVLLHEGEWNIDTESINNQYYCLLILTGKLDDYIVIGIGA